MMQIERTGIMKEVTLVGAYIIPRGKCWRCPSEDSSPSRTLPMALGAAVDVAVPFKVKPCFFRPLRRASKECEKQLER